MAKPSDYTITTFQRAPGLWRASIVPMGSVADRKMRSLITEEDSASEADAERSAAQMIKMLDE